MDSVCCTPLYLLIVYRSLVIVGGHFFSLNIFTGVFSDYISISIFLLALYNYIIQNNSNWCNVPLKKSTRIYRSKQARKIEGGEREKLLLKPPTLVTD